MTVADASAVRRVVGEVDFEYGCEYLDEHDAGLHLPQAGSDALLRAVSEVKANPAWTLLLEGHCRGLPDEIDDIRGSIAEEAADFCKDTVVHIYVCVCVSVASIGHMCGLAIQRAGAAHRRPAV